MSTLYVPEGLWCLLTWVTGDEDLALIADAGAVTHDTVDLSGDTVVTGGKDTGCSLQSQFKPFIALTLLVVDGPCDFAWAVGEGDDGWRGQGSALEGTFVAADVGIRVNLSSC